MGLNEISLEKLEIEMKNSLLGMLLFCLMCMRPAGASAIVCQIDSDCRDQNKACEQSVGRTCFCRPISLNPSPCKTESLKKFTEFPLAELPETSPKLLREELRGFRPRTFPRRRNEYVDEGYQGRADKMDSIANLAWWMILLIVLGGILGLCCSVALCAGCGYLIYYLINRYN